MKKKGQLYKLAAPLASIAVGLGLLAYSASQKKSPTMDKTPATPKGGTDKLNGFSYSSDGTRADLPWLPDRSMTDPELIEKVDNILTELRGQGFSPMVYELQRTAARGAWLKDTGKSKLGSRSLHVVGGDSGRNLSRAADIIDAKTHWEDLRFFDALAAAAKNEGLVSGWTWKTFKDGAHVELMQGDRT